MLTQTGIKCIPILEGKVEFDAFTDICVDHPYGPLGCFYCHPDRIESREQLPVTLGGAKVAQKMIVDIVTRTQKTTYD